MLAGQKTSQSCRGNNDVLIGPSAFGRSEFLFQQRQHFRSKTRRGFKRPRAAACQHLGAQQPHCHYRQHCNQGFQPITTFQLALFDARAALEGFVIFFDPSPRRIAAHHAEHLGQGLARQ